MLVHEKPSVFADSIFELIGAVLKGGVVGFGNLMLLCNADVENEGQLDFSEFVKAVSTYCMFGKEDILKCTASRRWCSLVAFWLIVRAAASLLLHLRQGQEWLHRRGRASRSGADAAPQCHELQLENVS